MRCLSHNCGLVLVLSLLAAACNDDPGLTEPHSLDATPELAATATPLSFYQIDASIGPDNTCGVTTTWQAYCWGTGYLGDGPAPSSKRSTPVAVAGGYQFRLIDAGFRHTCAITTDNRAFCWGENYAGQLGDGTTTDRPTPVQAAPTLRFRQISAGHGTTCGLTTENRVYCWGSSGGGAMGTGATSGTWGNPPTQIAGGRTYNQVSTGFNHSCAVTATSYEIFCWGSNQNGQLGDSSTAKVRFSPSRVSGTRQFKQVSAGWEQSCAVTTANRAFCWGYNSSGQVGDGTTLNRWEPRQVAGSVLFERVTAGVGQTCAESTTNKAYCWGYNSTGMVGDGTQTTRTKPVAVAGNLWFGQVSAGNGYTCGVTSDTQRGYCWGGNTNGTLGDGTTENRLTPTPVIGPSS